MIVVHQYSLLNLRDPDFWLSTGFAMHLLNLDRQQRPLDTWTKLPLNGYFDLIDLIER
jgi:hypothetical protein